MEGRYEHEDTSGLQNFVIVFNLIVITFQIYFMLATTKASVDILTDVRNICLQKLSVDSEKQKKEWQMNQIELIRKALSSDSNLQTSTANFKSYDIPEGPSYKNPIVQRKYDATLMDDEGYQGIDTKTEEIERTPNFYTKSKFATKIGSIYFRLLFVQKFSRWFVMWFRSNSQMAGGSAVDLAVRDTYMRASLWELVQIVPKLEEILQQIQECKSQKDIIPYLKNDHHTDRDDEKFYHPDYTVSTSTENIQVRCFLTQSGVYAFSIRSPRNKRFGSKVWIGPRVILYPGEMKSFVKLIKTYELLVEEYEKQDQGLPEDMDTSDYQLSVEDLKQLMI